jgi:signal transduction histidine kinase
VRSIAILLVGGILIASLLKGQFGLTFWQLFVIFIGFTLTYQTFRFFGFPTIYIITATGIAVYFATGHLDYRLFFPFKEIAHIERTYFQQGKNWDYFARTRDVGTEGLLLIPKDIKGFSKRMEKLFIAPQDIDKFLEQLPYGYGNRA